MLKFASKGDPVEIPFGHLTATLWPDHEGGPWLQFVFEREGGKREVLASSPVVDGMSGALRALADKIDETPMEAEPA